jgi:putative ABC transport system permease protein
MRILHTVKTSFKAIVTNRSRSSLTILGVVIGVIAIIMVVSLSQGASDLILKQVEGFGATTVSIQPGREPKGPADFAQMFSDSLKKKEFEALSKKINVPDFEEVVPIVIITGSVAHEGETYRSDMRGVGSGITTLFDFYPSPGRFFTDEDVRARSSVAVIGWEVKEQLFGLSDAVDKKIKIKEKTFRVIGVIPKKGQVGFLNLDKMIFVPYTTAQDYLLGVDHYNALVARVNTKENVDRAVQDAQETLRLLHDITDPEKDDFHIETQADAAERIGMITGALQALLVSIAAISLIVGGIGIMNIMLVSVTERTREIGLRKAIGARKRDILRQFLIEATMLTVSGGVIGILGGAFFSFVLAIILQQFVSDKWSYVFPIGAAIVGIIVSVVTGLVFGLYPARKAAEKSPIEALRYE